MVLILTSFFFIQIGNAGEQLNLTTPVTRSSTSSYIIDSIHLDWSNKVITIILLDTVTGEKPVFSYYGVVAQNMMIALNKVNLSITSLQKRVFQQLITDGKLSGTVSGIPD